MAREVQETYEDFNSHARVGRDADYLDKLLPDDWISTHTPV